MLVISRSELSKLVPLLCAVIVVSVGAYFVGTNAITHMLRANVEANAQNWGQYIVRNVPKIAYVLNGTAPVESSADFFDVNQQSGSAYRYRIYDPRGHVLVDSGGTVDHLAVSDSAVVSNRQATDVFNSLKSDFAFVQQDVMGASLSVAHIFAPLMMDGDAIGVIEIVSDETTNWAMLQGQFKQVAIQFIALILLAFGLPGFLYLRRSGQLEFAALNLKHTSETDELTGSLNRVTFNKFLNDRLRNSEAAKMQVAVHFIDLDRFKDINDMRGHAVGDEILRQANQRLRKLLGLRERLARLGGDEFAICQPFRTDSPEVVDDLANDIARAMAKPFYIEDFEIRIGASVGYAFHPRDGSTADDLVRAADIALYRAKQSSRGKAMAFDPSMESERKARQATENRLRTALQRDEFDINYQPLYDTTGTNLRGFEALLRLNAEDGTPISPVVFIPIAEEVGLIGEIGLWVLRASAKMACEWPDDLTVSVNLSPAQFQSHDMPKVVADVLRETGLSAHRLELEVTESLLIADTERVLKELRAIKQLGVSIALDDFGTGYSSLSYLWHFPFDKLKVDKSFMTDLAVSGSKSREILSTIIALGRVLDLKITAEGVETEDQALVLRELNCDLIQGFLYGRPMKAVDVAAILVKKVERDLENRKGLEQERLTA